MTAIEEYIREVLESLDLSDEEKREAIQRFFRSEVVVVDD